MGAGVWVLWSLFGVAEAASVGDTWPLLLSTIAGGALGAAARWRPLLWIGAANAGLLLVIAYTPLAPILAQQLIRADSAPVTAAQAVVVLGAGITADGLTGLSGLERLLSGLALTSPADSGTLVLSIVRRAPGDTVTGFRDLERLVALAGGRRVAWLNNVFSTRDEAMEVRALAGRRGWQTVVIVTSPPHSRRACATFEHAGLRVICRPSEGRVARSTGADSPRERLIVWRFVVYEALGSMVYQWRGWI